MVNVFWCVVLVLCQAFLEERCVQKCPMYCRQWSLVEMCINTCSYYGVGSFGWQSQVPEEPECERPGSVKSNSKNTLSKINRKVPIGSWLWRRTLFVHWTQIFIWYWWGEHVSLFYPHSQLPRSFSKSTNLHGVTLGQEKSAQILQKKIKHLYMFKEMIEACQIKFIQVQVAVQNSDRNQRLSWCFPKTMCPHLL